MFPSTLMTERGSSAILRVVLSRQASTAVQASSTHESSLKLPPSQGIKTAKIANGLHITTVDNYHPVTRISLVFKAGSRYESSYTRGIVHRLRNLVGLSTNRRTAIDFNHYVHSQGAIFTATASRDYLTYDIQVNRRNLVHGFRILDEFFSEPFHVQPHELEDSAAQMKREIQDLKQNNWPGHTLEKLHKVAYRRNGLANSIYSPNYALGHHSPGELACYAHGYLVTGNANLVVSSADHDEVQKWAADIFTLKQGPAASAPEKAKFHGGDSRKLAKSDRSVVQIGAPSVGLDDVRGTLTHTVLANVLGTGPSIKWSEGGQTRLARAVRKVTSNPFHVAASNIGYDGAGLFTIYYSSNWADSAALAKAAIGELRSIASQGIKDEELQSAKNRVKYRLLSLAEDEDYVVEDLAVQAAVRQKDICGTKEQLKLIDMVTSGDVQQAAKNIVNGKFAIAAKGRLDKTPYSDELSA